MLVSKKCVDIVSVFEGFKSTPYKDGVGVWTLGYGMTGALIKGLKSITQPQAYILLQRALNLWSASINTDLNNHKVVLNQNQFDAIISMSYNIGIGGMLGSTLYKLIVSGNRDRATLTPHFLEWHKGSPSVEAGLLARRKKECELFFTQVSVPIKKTVPTKTVYPRNGIVTSDKVNVREKADITSKALTELRKGAIVKIAGISNGFYSIYYGNHGAYISTKYVK